MKTISAMKQSTTTYLGIPQIHLHHLSAQSNSPRVIIDATCTRVETDARGTQGRDEAVEDVPNEL